MDIPSAPVPGEQRSGAGLGRAGVLGAGVTLVSKILPPRLRGFGVDRDDLEPD